MKLKIVLFVLFILVCLGLYGCFKTASPSSSALSSNVSSQSSAVLSSANSSAASSNSSATSSASSATENLKTLLSDASSYYYENSFDKCIAECNTALTIDPNSFEAYSLKGISLFRQGKYTEGRTLISKAIEIKNNYTLAYYFMGFSYKLKKDYDNTLIWFNKALLIDPKDVWSIYGIATVYADRDQTEKAFEYLKKSVAIMPSIKDLARGQNHWSKYLNNAEFKEIVS